MSPALKEALEVLEFAAAVFGVLGGTATFLWAIYGRFVCRLVWTRRITDGEDNDLDGAISLYRDRFRGNIELCDTGEDIRRWLDEIREAEAAGIAEWQALLVVAKRIGGVCGFFSAELHLPTGLLFVSYLAVDQKDALKQVPKRIARRVLKECRRGHGNLSGIVFELEAGGDPDESAARYRLFRRVARDVGVHIKRIVMDYDQPRLSLWDSRYTETPLYLLYGRAAGRQLGETLDKSEVVSLLDALLNTWYASSFEDEPEHDREYRAYVRAHFDRTIAQLREEVRLTEKILPRRAATTPPPSRLPTA